MPSFNPIGKLFAHPTLLETNSRFASGMTNLIPGLLFKTGLNVSASKWSVWLWLDVTIFIPFSNSGLITISLILICGLSVVAYFFVNESDRYGSINTLFPFHCSKNPLWPNHHKW